MRISPFLRSSLALSSSTAGRLLLGVAKSKTAALVLGTEGVGLLGLLSQLEMLGASIVSLSMANGIARRVSQERTSHVARAAGTALWIVGALSLAFLLLGGASVLFAANFLPFWAMRWHLLLPVLLAVPLHSIVASYVMGVYFGFERIREYSRCSLLAGAVELVLFLFLVRPLGVAGALWATAFGFAGWLVLALYGLRNIPGALPHGAPAFDSKIAAELVRAGLVLTATGVLTYLTNTLIRAHFLEALGADQAGVYHVSIVFSSLYMPLLTNGIWARLHPKMSAEPESDEANHEWAEALVFVALFGSLMQAGLVCFSGLAIQLLYSRDFLPATALIPVQMAGDFFFVLAQPTLAVLLARGRLALFLLVWLGYYCVLCALTIAFSSVYGLMAAPYAYGIAALGLSMFGVVYFARHSRKPSRSLKTVLVVIGCLVALSGAVLVVGSLGLVSRLVFVAVWGSVVFGLYFGIKSRLLD